MSEESIANVITKLKTKSSHGYDNISNKLIKSKKIVLIKPLTLIVYQCLHISIYPSQLKLSHVKLLLKSGHNSQFNYYMPITNAIVIQDFLICYI